MRHRIPAFVLSTIHHSPFTIHHSQCYLCFMTGGLRSKEEWLSRMMKWCAYQERARSEVEQKLRKGGCAVSWIEGIIDSLEEHDFLNETRFANAYASGKFRMKQWGRMKIMAGLRSKGIADELIQSALKEIEETEYRDTIVQLIAKKKDRLQSVDPHEQRSKILAYLSSKGYEVGLVRELIN